MPSNDLDSHLRASHKGVRKSTRDSIRETFADVPAAKFTADLQPLPDGSPPSSFLVPARCGFYCPACPTFRSFHEREIRHHSIKMHGHNTKPTEVQKNACCTLSTQKNRLRFFASPNPAGSCAWSRGFGFPTRCQLRYRLSAVVKAFYCHAR